MIAASRAKRLSAKSCFVCFFFFILAQPCLTFAAQEWKTVFDPFSLITLHLEIAPNDWDRVRLDQPSQSESWVPEVAEALFWTDGETPLRVAVRRKGESDIPLPEGNPQKVSLKIDINEFVPGQKWRGLNKLSLENGSDNPLEEGFAWLLHRLAWEAGIYGYEAAYAGWVRLFINGELKGVFVNAEQRDAQFLRNHGYDKPSGTWLYKVDGSSTLEVGTGHSPAYQHLCYTPFDSGPGGGGGQGGCTQPNLETDLPLWVDIQGFFTLAAVHAFSENRDDLFSHSGKNSYAVDFYPPYPRTRLYFPWDLDTTFDEGRNSIYGNTVYQIQLLAHPWFQRVYEQILRDLITGPFAPAALHAVLDRLQTSIGPAFDEDPYVYTSGSASAFADMHAWVDARVASVGSQLTQPWIPGPEFNQAGGEVIAGFNLVMSAPAGAIYYTLDGSDPRAPGGSVAPSAVLYSAPVLIDRSTQVTARAFDGATWSALPTIANFSIARYAKALRVTEIMYHPNAGSLPEDEYEFVELKNTGAQSLMLAGYYFEGIDFTFPASTVLPPGGFFVLARNATAFSNRYATTTVDGIYWGKLSDAGEKLRLRDSQGNTVISIEYDDDPPWPVSADGLGYSLVLAEMAGNPDDSTTWRASSQQHGSPGRDDPNPSYGLGVVINEILAHTDAPLMDAIELFNIGPTSVDISGWYLSDDCVSTNPAGDYSLKKYRVPAGTVIPPGGYRVFYANDFQTSNPLVPFALSELGETVYLSSANSAGELTGYVMGGRFGPSENGISVGRYATSTGVDFVPLTQITFGAGGQGAPNAPPLVGPVVINEIMYNPTGGQAEFLELLNLTDASINLSGWRIAGADYTFPTGTLIAGNGLLVLLKTNTTSVADFRAYHQLPASVPIYAHDFVLENEGEALRLEKPNTSPLEPPFEKERVRYNDKSPWPTEADGEGPSLERFSASEYGNDPINWRTVQAGGSPGRPNRFVAGMGIAKGSAWKYHDLGNNLGTAWRAPDYSDSSWPSGDGVLGYGLMPLGTVLAYGADPAQKPVTVHFRKEFVINDPLSSILNLKFQALYDDGFALYLNGTEIMRSASMPPGPLTYSTTAATGYNSIGYETFDLSEFVHLLRVGGNVLCAELHQESPSSDDLLWDAALTYDVSTQPTVALPLITPPGGGFATPVQISIQTATSDATIHYTLNGTDPEESSAVYVGPFNLETSAQVRARAYKPGYNESGISAVTFWVGVPGYLEVSPAGNLSSSGMAGGPFSPPSITYTLTNSGGLPLDWSVSKSQEWVSLSATSGTLALGGSTTLLAAVNTNAEALPAGTYSETLQFVNATTGVEVTSRSIWLTVAPASIFLRAALLLSGPLQITVEGRPFQTYTIERSADGTLWNSILTKAAGADGILRHEEPTNTGQRFYRARPAE